jgi:hypothetical protein
MNRRALLVALCALPLAACQSVEGDLRMLAEKPPKEIDSSPGTSALLVVEASLELTHGAKIPMTGAALLRQGTERIRFTGAEDDMVVFHGLPPDGYEIVWLYAPWMRYETPSKYPLPEEQGGVLRLEAGVPRYLGFVRIVRHSQTEFEYLWDRGAEREAAAWRKILERYPTTTWRERIEARIEALGQ